MASAVAMGVGIWSMHFIAMLALRIDMTVVYEIPLLVVSMLIAISASAITFTGAARGVTTRRLALASLAMGPAIAGMHYTGMAAMHMPARIEYSMSLVIALHQVGRSLTSELDLTKLVQVVTDAGTELTGAQFGAFFYNVVNEVGEAFTLYPISGVPREAFSKFPMPRNTPILAPTFHGTGVVRSDDITKDPRYGTMDPHHGMPSSWSAVSRAGRRSRWTTRRCSRPSSARAPTPRRRVAPRVSFSPS
ncbi:MAG: hypothetical protein H0T54_04530 [Geodermatophilaceae bacterium]|nr:hypothetical protein [Geodermatophilaceae bacterium]